MPVHKTETVLLVGKIIVLYTALGLLTRGENQNQQQAKAETSNTSEKGNGKKGASFSSRRTPVVPNARLIQLKLIIR